ncbi:hypothetical protein H2198_010515 [Neophaeococcomyces mojaviensis]|uniref:Uncharacterized protein n=1 Tax=Neophaeococcomyces mojaviensis TaxID=3383035 RepID=A0ACC2ZRH3_9EURO|nr:hypothetical protein H2198_010515 [Knufia sp. JES_112]
MAYGLPDWLTGSSKPAQPEVPKTPDGGFVAPDRNKRELCYESRDIFFECLDKHDILDAIREDEKARKACPTEVAEYERDCARSWIKYFKEKRVQDWKRDQTIAQIQKEDAEAAAKARSGKKWFG